MHDTTGRAESDGDRAAVPRRLCGQVAVDVGDEVSRAGVEQTYLAVTADLDDSCNRNRRANAVVEVGGQWRGDTAWVDRDESRQPLGR